MIVSGRDEARGAEVTRKIEEHGGVAAFRRCDVGDTEAVREFAAGVEGDFGPVDILVNSAGIFRGSKAVDDSLEDDLRSMWEVNVAGLLIMCQEFGRRMIERKHGRIVNLASVSGLRGHREGAAYGAGKGAVVQLTRMLAVEWIKDGVNVNCIAPSDFDTPMNAEYTADPEYLEYLAGVVPAERVGRPEELDAAVLYLVSAMAKMVVGETLVVDGGMTMSCG